MPPLKQSGPDLIHRYNLGSKIGWDDGAAMASASPGEASRPSWSSSKAERQSLLQMRREEMILAARRKMLENEKGKS